MLSAGVTNPTRQGLPGSCKFLKIRAALEQPRIVPTVLSDSFPIPYHQQSDTGFITSERLATIDLITRLNKVHLHYGSHLRLSQTQCNSLPPYILKLLETARDADSTGLSPAELLHASWRTA